MKVVFNPNPDACIKDVEVLYCTNRDACIKDLKQYQRWEGSAYARDAKTGDICNMGMPLNEDQYLIRYPDDIIFFTKSPEDLHITNGNQSKQNACFAAFNTSCKKIIEEYSQAPNNKKNKFVKNFLVQFASLNGIQLFFKDVKEENGVTIAMQPTDERFVKYVGQKIRDLRDLRKKQLDSFELNLEFLDD